MVEVTKDNFEELLPNIEKSINNASFIALDAEFTGLKVGATDCLSLFDSMEERYQKLKIRATNFTVSQIGISAFKRHSSGNSYQVETYVFYVRPYLCGKIDKTFLCQASCIDFLCRYNFDFNKFFKNGIPFMNETEVKQFKEELEEDRFTFPYNFLDKKEDILINDALLRNEKCPNEEDLKTEERLREEKSKMILQLPKDTLYPAYFQIIQLKKKYPSLSAYATDNEIIVEKGASRKLENLTEEKEKALNFCLGFTKVFRLLKEASKPIVGHNFLMDLLLFYHNFHQPLPENYNAFKQELHSAFPAIYDTRQIWRNLKKFTSLKNIPGHSGLFDLHELFKKPPPSIATLFVPSIEFCNGNKYVKGEFPHDSGYDSYVTGLVFLNICHLIAIKKAKSPVFIEPQTFKQHLNAVQLFINKINLSRSRFAFVNLDGDDPTPTVPEYLHVSKKNKEFLSEQELTVIFEKYGVIDVRLLPSKREAVIAVATRSVFKEILTEFKDNRNFVITEYHLFKHSFPLNKTLWATALGSVCVAAFLVAKMA